MTRYVVVFTDLADKAIYDGPLLWDGNGSLGLPGNRQPMTEAVAISQGYRYPPPSAAVANSSTLATRAAGALAGNAAYLTIAIPTASQAIPQVERLTRQVNAIIRLLLNQTDDTTGT